MRGARECGALSVVHVLVGTYMAQRRGQVWRFVWFWPNRAMRAILAWYVRDVRNVRIGRIMRVAVKSR